MYVVEGGSCRKRRVVMLEGGSEWWQSENKGNQKLVALGEPRQSYLIR